MEIYNGDHPLFCGRRFLLNNARWPGISHQALCLSYIYCRCNQKTVPYVVVFFVKPALHGQIVGHSVALATLRGLHGLGVRLAVTPAASRDLSVARVTVRTSDGRMFGHVVLKHIVDIAVASRTNL